MRAATWFVVLTWCGLVASEARAAPHPRLFLDATVRAQWKADAARAGSPVATSIATCKAIASDRARYGRDYYMGLDWARNLQHCLVAWAATDDDRHARTAIVYLTAMLDDLVEVGDGKGGDAAATRDSGFSIRALGPYTAIAYDWLHDHPAMTEALRARARGRWKAWTDWYLANGYRARSPSTNYHAGYLAAVTLIAIAQRDEAGADGAALWRLVTDEIWGKDMARALAPGGVLDGGGWGEGWQYGPLSVVEYAASARAMAAQGVAVPGARRWLDGLMLHTIYARAPGGGVWPGGDTDFDQPHLPLNPNTLFAVMLGDASASSRAWAAGELATITSKPEFPLWAALATASATTATPAPRADWPTAYRVAGTGTFFARTGWDPAAIWVVSQCNKTIDVDHSHPNAGNLALSRGADDLIVDPTPYGSLSTLTGNAPTVESAHLPADYKPSQAWWSEATGFRWARQTTSGVIATRCDYADQYKFQDRPSDVPAAQRDLIVVPWGNHNATAIVVDRAASGDPARGLHLRFRTPGKLAATGAQAVATVGGSKLRVTAIATSGGTPGVDRVPAGSCFSPGWTRGDCAAARFAIDQWRAVVPGPTMTAIHAIDLVGARDGLPVTTAARAGDVTVIEARAAGFAVVVGGGETLGYRGPAAAHHVVVDGPDLDAVTVRGQVDGDGCRIEVATAGAGIQVTGRPHAFFVDASCAIVADGPPLAPTGGGGGPSIAPDATPDAAPDAAPAAQVDPPRSPRIARTGCCGAQTSPTGSLALAVAIAAWLGRRRRAV